MAADAGYARPGWAACQAAFAELEQMLSEPQGTRSRGQRSQAVTAVADAVLRLLSAKDAREQEELRRSCSNAVEPAVRLLLRVCGAASRQGDTALQATAHDALLRAAAALVLRGEGAAAVPAHSQKGNDALQLEVFTRLGEALHDSQEGAVQRSSLQVFAALAPHAETSICRRLLRGLVHSLSRALSQGQLDLLRAYGGAARLFAPPLLPGAAHAEHRQLWVPTLALLSHSDDAVRRSAAQAAVAVLRFSCAAAALPPSPAH
eukprot:TRINITY_DN12422_c0_g1_i2.p1 TRINITY_DN12422_c0_g1~~TRINITY_DN12422_c0_g1_i2.p1  ORF type:complete len:290 (+),score=83.37 TRINITY_DN12422_c0_g1_i2:87-872(+)